MTIIRPEPGLPVTPCLDDIGDLSSTRPATARREAGPGRAPGRMRHGDLHGRYICKANVARTCNAWNGRLTRSDWFPSYRGGN